MKYSVHIYEPVRMRVYEVEAISEMDANRLAFKQDDKEKAFDILSDARRLSVVYSYEDKKSSCGIYKEEKE